MNAKSPKGWTPLMAAAWAGNAVAAEVLLACGAEVDAADELGPTTLIGAAGNGHIEVVKLLLAKGANANPATDSGAKNGEGQTALAIAEEWDNDETLGVLRQAQRKPAPQPD